MIETLKMGRNTGSGSRAIYGCAARASGYLLGTGAMTIHCTFVK
jgi:hypothetical protein